MIDLVNKIKNRKAKICVIGLGYVGLPTSIFFAESGFDVIGADIDAVKVDIINAGRSPLKDLNLDQRIKKVTGNKKLTSTTNITKAVSASDIVLIIVPTPVNQAKEPDLGCVINAANDITLSLRKGQLVVLESTTYPGTTEEVLKPILEKGGLMAGKDFGLAYCPERYNPGDPIHSLDKVARIVGGIDHEWGVITCDLYQSIIKEKVTHVKNIKTAEAAKIIENIQRDLNIALMNELALIFERMDIDIIEVIKAASTKWNFGKYLPGPGVGGHCLPVDPYYLTKRAQELGYHAQVILAGRNVNDGMPGHVFDLVQSGLNEIGKPIKNSRILIMGAAYKANTGDLRNSPVETLIEKLKDQSASISIIEPNVEYREIYGCIHVPLEDYFNVKKDCIVLMVNHDEFRNMDLLNPGPDEPAVFVDACRALDAEDIIKTGFIYRGVGAGSWNK
jgi:nucleotide sugar dehydrogenase